MGISTGIDEGRKEGRGDGDPSYDADGLPTFFHPVRAVCTLELDACMLREMDGDDDENDRTGQDRTGHGKAGRAGLATYQCPMGMRV